MARGSKTGARAEATAEVAEPMETAAQEGAEMTPEEMMQVIEDQRLRIAELEEKLGEMEPAEDAEEMPAEAEAAVAKHGTPAAALAALSAQVQELRAQAAAQARDAAIDGLLARGLISPAEKEIAAHLYATAPDLYRSTYGARVEPVVPLGRVSHGAEPEAATTHDRIKAYAKAHNVNYATAHDAVLAMRS